MAKAGISRIGLYDVSAHAMNALSKRLESYFPAVHVTAGSANPAGYDVIVNATPLGMKKDDPLPIRLEDVSPPAFVGDVVLREEMTPFLAGARARGCEVQAGLDMLFEQIPAYLEFLGFGTASSDELRKLSQLHP